MATKVGESDDSRADLSFDEVTWLYRAILRETAGEYDFVSLPCRVLVVSYSSFVITLRNSVFVTSTGFADTTGCEGMVKSYSSAVSLSEQIASRNAFSALRYATRPTSSSPMTSPFLDWPVSDAYVVMN